ncbi:aromatic ring-hydroxylating dioxygenase subunit alpha, partial [Steroidobacter sp.]|uniref:aromatic ring-hydroxylating dioxygenase subunit alpha n=1 Tax=Steroidobacter sp. TaxID=1978227 RepID=UPI0025EDC90D
KKMFLNNAWYVAELSSGLGTGLVPVRLLGRSLVLYRLSNGEVAALEDACPHRKLPLSMGRRQGDLVECGYHGMMFDRAGACRRVPGNQPIPDTARVRSYPAVERQGFIWVWMGAPELADPASIFDIEHWDNPTWGRTEPDAMAVRCSYLHITDNLLDPTHVAWVHPDSFGESACEQTPLQTEALSGGVLVSRWMLSVDVAPFYVRYMRFAGKADRKQHYEVRFPGHARIRAVFTPAGNSESPDAETHPDTFVMDSYNFLTPIDERTTRYFWVQTRNFAPNDVEVSRDFGESVRGAFEEDKAVLEAVQLGIENAQSPFQPLFIDAGPARFRRELQRRIDAESNADR